MMTAPLFGATEAGNTVPERPATASSSSPASSVVSNPPYIPNVVEYHLKVKPGQTQRIHQLDNSTVSTQTSLRRDEPINSLFNYLETCQVSNNNSVGTWFNFVIRQRIFMQIRIFVRITRVSRI